MGKRRQYSERKNISLAIIVCTPIIFPEKVTPLFPATPFSKLRFCQAPLFQNLVGGSTPPPHPPPPPSRKGRGGRRVHTRIAKLIFFSHYIAFFFPIALGQNVTLSQESLPIFYIPNLLEEMKVYQSLK